MTPLVIVIKNREAQTAKPPVTQNLSWLPSGQIVSATTERWDPREGVAVFLSCLAAIFHILYYSIPWNVSYFSTHKYLSQNIRALTLITALRNYIHLPQSSSFSFKDPQIDLKQLVFHRRGTSCIIYREEQESEEQENRRKGAIQASDWNRRATSNLRWKLVER